MDNKLPKIYVQKQSNKINNNREFFYGNEKGLILDNRNKANVIRKLNLIFSKYAYKYNLLIKTNNGESKETIILKTRDYLLTINNKMIPIDSINDVEEIL